MNENGAADEADGAWMADSQAACIALITTQPIGGKGLSEQHIHGHPPADDAVRWVVTLGVTTPRRKLRQHGRRRQRSIADS